MCRRVVRSSPSVVEPRIVAQTGAGAVPRRDVVVRLDVAFIDLLPRRHPGVVVRRAGVVGVCEIGFEPIVVPASGSFAEVTDEGQRETLATLGLDGAGTIEFDGGEFADPLLDPATRAAAGDLRDSPRPGAICLGSRDRSRFHRPV